MAINDPRTSQRYMPRFEVWMNVFIHYAFTNVVNSLSMLETMTLAEKGAMLTGMKAPIDKLVGNVLKLDAHIIGLWREKDQEFADASKTFHESIHEQAPSVMRMKCLTCICELLILLSPEPNNMGLKYQDIAYELVDWSHHPREHCSLLC